MLWDGVLDIGNMIFTFSTNIATDWEIFEGRARLQEDPGAGGTTGGWQALTHQQNSQF